MVNGTIKMERRKEKGSRVGGKEEGKEEIECGEDKEKEDRKMKRWATGGERLLSKVEATKGNGEGDRETGLCWKREEAKKTGGVVEDEREN